MSVAVFEGGKKKGLGQLLGQFVKQMTAYDPQIIGDHTPEHLGLKMGVAFPGTAPQPKAPLEVGNIRLNAAAPFLQTGVHVLAADDVL